MKQIPVTYFDPVTVTKFLSDKHSSDCDSQVVKKCVQFGIQQVSKTTKSILVMLRKDAEQCRKLVSAILHRDISVFNNTMNVVNNNKRMMMSQPQVEKINKLVADAHCLRTLIDKNNSDVAAKFPDLSAEEKIMAYNSISDACFDCLSSVEQFLKVDQTTSLSLK